MEHELQQRALHEATYGLAHREPQFSAAQVISRGQRNFLLIAIAFGAAVLCVWPNLTSLLLTALIAVGYLANAIFRAWLFWIGAEDIRPALVAHLCCGLPRTLATAPQSLALGEDAARSQPHGQTTGGHMSEEWANAVILAGILLVLGGTLFLRLRACDFNRASAAALSALALLQPAFSSAVIGIRSALFGLAAYATASSSAALLHRQDPRRIVLFGTSLAGAQMIHPLCGTLTALVLPVMLRKSLVASRGSRTAGLYLSMLFIPAVVSVVLFYLSLSHRLTLPQWPPLSLSAVTTPHLSVLLILLSALPFLIALTRSPNGRLMPALAAIGGSVVVTSVAIDWLGMEDQFGECAAALSPLLVLAAGDVTHDSGMMREMFLVIIVNALLVWGLVLGRRYGHA